ncbi:hypothetical protein CWS31_003875 [Colwellia echini]|uniref:Uncharacterized protein n=1 Tax=Colwellia echini TaxID=1982103 RepID=A0ABY3N0B8_9GAMM|nr:hypothetical protein CWS31_003875 [Colwellia echini]
MDINQARIKANCNHVTSVSLDHKAFVPLIHIKRSDVLYASEIRVMLSSRRSIRTQAFLTTYAIKIKILNPS